MVGLHSVSWRTAALGGLALAMASLPAPAQAASGTVRIEIVKAGFVVGIGGGRGTLNFNGRAYPLRIGGVSLGATIGASKTEFVGRATNLTRASDIAGTYTALDAGAAVAGGAGVTRLRNSKGVIMELRGRKIGLEVNVSISGMEVSLR